MASKGLFVVRFGKGPLTFSSLLILALISPLIIYAQVVSPKISITSSQNPSGITINIKGTGSTAGSTATLYAKKPDGSQAAIQNMNVSADGTFIISHLFPAGYLPGTYILWVVDDSTGKYSNRVNFNMPSTQSTKKKTPSSTNLHAYAPKHSDLIRGKGDTKIYLVQNGQRRCFANDQVFTEWGFKKKDVRETDLRDMMNIPEGPPIWKKEFIGMYSDGTLIRLRGRTETYVIQGGRKCYIPDPETFQSRGYSWNQVKEVDKATLDRIDTGIPIPSVKTPYQYTPPGQQPAVQTPPPTGPPPMTQPQSPSSQTPSQPYGSPTTQSGSGSTLYQTQPQSSSSFFADGTLIKGSGPDVYLIQNGTKRLIPDMQTFNALGFNWNNIINVDDQRLGNISTGIPFTRQRTK